MNIEIAEILASGTYDLRRRRTIVTVLFCGLAALSLSSAWLLFRVESRVFPEFIGDATTGTFFALILEVAKPLLTLAGWFVIASPGFRAPAAVKTAGIVFLPFLLWGVSSFCVFSSVALSTNHPNLEATRQADLAAVISEYANTTNLLHSQETDQLHELDDTLKHQRAQFESSLAEASHQFSQRDQSLRGQLITEMQAAGAEPDFEKVQTIVRHNDDQIQRDREALRREFEAQRRQAINERDAAFTELNRQRQALVFRKDTSAQKAEVANLFERRVASLKSEFESKDDALRSHLKGGVPVATASHAAAAKSLQDELDALAKNHQASRSDTLLKQRLVETEITNQRRGIQDQLEKSMAAASASLSTRLDAVKTRDYSSDPRVENKLVADTLATIREGFGITNLSRAGFVAGFALAVSFALEAILWVSTVWAALLLANLCAGVPVSLEEDAKKNFCGKEFDLNGLNSGFDASKL